MLRPSTFARIALLALILISTAACGGSVNETFSTIGYGLSDGGDAYATPAAGRSEDRSALAGEAQPNMPFDSAMPAPATEPEVPAAGGPPPGETGALPAAGPTSSGAPGGAAGPGAPGGDMDASAYGDSRPRNVGKNAPPGYQSPLTAGQVDDNARFDDYLKYLREYQGPQALPIAIEERRFIRVVDAQQRPIAGARVEIYDGQRKLYTGRTVSDGRVLFLPREAGASQAQSLRALISRGQYRTEAPLTFGSPEQTIPLDVADNVGTVFLDLVFLLDATGSMGDEIDHIKATIDTIATRIEQLPGSATPRFGLVAYKDTGDEYITRKWDFTDVQGFSANLSEVYAGGGGDYPESVNAGLSDAINLPGWSSPETGRHLRMIVLVGDAPPHLDYANDTQYPTLLGQAAAAGIKIFPIGGSGLQEQGEYIFRQFAQVTQGQFVFLTYANGVSGAPGPATELSVSDFTVNNLDNLVVNLVAAEIANQTGEKVEARNPVPSTSLTTITQSTSRPDLLATVGTAAQQLFAPILNTATLFWTMLLFALLAWAGQRGRRARVAALPAVHFSLPPADEADIVALPRERVIVHRQDQPLPEPTLHYYHAPATGQRTIRLKARHRSVPARK